MNQDFDRNNKLNAMVQMIGEMAALNFSSRIDANDPDPYLAAVAQGLNWLSEELEANSVQKYKLEEVNETLKKFAYIAAHDLKSPLNLSFGWIDLIERKLGDEQHEIKAYLIELKKTNQHMRRLIDGILEYSRQNFSDVKLERIDLDSLCRKSVSLYELQGAVSICIENTLPIVTHHEIALTQIFDNLINNAIKHCSKDHCFIQIASKERPDYYEVSISDNGPGIKKENQNKIFDLFENLKRSNKDSSGIGLATVKKIVTETNGQIWVESPIKNGEGTTFLFTIRKES